MRAYIMGNKDVYKRLIEYEIEKCDTVSVSEYVDRLSNITKNTMSIILPKTYVENDDIINNCSEESYDSYIDKLYDTFKNNQDIFNKECKKKYGISNKKYSKANDEKKRDVIAHAVERALYERIIKKWLRIYKNNILLKKEDSNMITYFIKLNGMLKKDLLSRNSFCDWSFPCSIEDLSFYKNGYCLLRSTWRGLHDVFCEDEKEYKYLKSIGVKFDSKKFVLESKDKLNFL